MRGSAVLIFVHAIFWFVLILIAIGISADLYQWAKARLLRLLGRGDDVA